MKRDGIAELIARADREQWADPSFRRELSAWIHPNRTRTRDGMPGYAFDLGTLESLVGAAVVRTFDRGDGQAARDRELAKGSPAIAVLGTDLDHPSAWLNAGQALAGVILHATVAGLSVSFLNQPLERHHLRPLVTELLGETGHAQAILRMGFGPTVPPTPRRSVEDVIIPLR